MLKAWSTNFIGQQKNVHTQPNRVLLFYVNIFGASSQQQLKAAMKNDFQLMRFERFERFLMMTRGILRSFDR